MVLFDETSPIMLYVVRKSRKKKVCYMLFVKVRKERSSAGSKVGNSNPHGEFGNHDEQIQSLRSAQSGNVSVNRCKELVEQSAETSRDPLDSWAKPHSGCESVSMSVKTSFKYLSNN